MTRNAPESEYLFLCGLSAGAATDFRALIRLSYCKRGSLVFSAGDATRGLVIISAGRVKLSACSNKGRTVTFRIAGPGEVVGLSSTITGAPYEFTAQTLAPSQLAFMERADFLGFLERHPETWFRVLELISREVTSAREQIAFLGGALPASVRLAMLLLGWCGNSGEEADNGIRLALPLTAREVGNMIGSSRETIARLLSRLRDARIIERRGRIFVIRDKAALEELASSRYPSRPELRPVALQRQSAPE